MRVPTLPTGSTALESLRGICSALCAVAEQYPLDALRLRWASLRPVLAEKFGALEELIHQTAPSVASEFLSDHQIRQTVPTIRVLRSNYEYLSELDEARKILAAPSPDAMLNAHLDQNYPTTTIHSDDFIARSEQHHHCLVIGSGPLPVTGLLLRRHTSLPVTCLDRDPLSCHIGDLVTQAAGHGDIQHIQGDCLQIDDLSGYDLIVVTALVSDCSSLRNGQKKTRIISHIAQLVQPGTTLCLRVPFALGEILYPSIDVHSLINFETHLLEAPCPGRSSMLLAYRP